MRICYSYISYIPKVFFQRYYKYNIFISMNIFFTLSASSGKGKDVLILLQWECLVPHPPIIIPEVGQGREQSASRTVEAMETLAQSLQDHVPDTILLLSPHSAYSKGICFLIADKYSGSLAMFGHPEVKLAFKGSPDESDWITKSLIDANIDVHFYRDTTMALDHASLVPLYFFSKYWKEFPKIIIANPIGLTPRMALETGRILNSLKKGASLALIASGDLSHRLTSDAPAGFNPKGKIFDDLVVESLKTNEPENLLQADISILEGAGECGLRSVMVFMGCAAGKTIKVLSYEGPFGVGYCVARTEDSRSEKNIDKNPFVELAKQAIICHLKGEDNIKSIILQKKQRKQPHACFVSLKTREGQLRGCIGTVTPLRESLAEEIVENSISAATRDPRFPPVSLDELDDLLVSVDILSEPCEVKNIEDLDVRKFGVIVEKEYRRGVLLPDLDGVTSIEQQIAIAASKAGIHDLKDSTIYRFTVERHSEKEYR